MTRGDFQWTPGMKETVNPVPHFILPLLRKHRKTSVKTAEGSNLSMEALTLGACVSSLIGIAFVWLFFAMVRQR